MVQTTDHNAGFPVSRALVLGGGASLGRAFHWGLAAGLLDAGVDLRDADRIIGTSAGAVIGVRLGLGMDSRLSLPDVDPPSSAPLAGIWTALQQIFAASARAIGSQTPENEWKTVGELALTAEVPDEQTSFSRKTLSDLVGKPWPSNFWATTVDAESGRFEHWTARSNVPLERGVASSGALPGVWPAVTIGARRYIDGGVRSMLNADLAIGAARVLVISCFDLSSPEGTPDLYRAINQSLLAETDRLRESGAAVAVITPNEAFLQLSGYGTKMFDGSLVPQAYELSRHQAREEIDRVRGVWLP